MKAQNGNLITFTRNECDLILMTQALAGINTVCLKTPAYINIKQQNKLLTSTHSNVLASRKIIGCLGCNSQSNDEVLIGSDF